MEHTAGKWAPAPDLLKACKIVNEWLRSNTLATNRPASLDKILMDAISKAEGRRKGGLKMGKKYKCETCKDTGFYGDNGPGITGNREYQACDMCLKHLYMGPFLDISKEINNALLSKGISTKVYANIHNIIQKAMARAKGDEV